MADINTDISGLTWLHHRPIGTALAEGARTGNLIGQALLQMQAQRAEQQKEEATAPLREAQREYYLQKTALDLKTEATKAQQDLNMRQGFSQLSEVIAKVGEYPEKWLDPSFQKDFWQTATEHPEVAKHPAFDNVIANFPLAERLSQQRDLAAAAAEERALSAESAQDLKALAITAGLEREAMRADTSTSNTAMRTESSERIAGLNADTKLAIATMNNATQIQRFLDGPKGLALTRADRGQLKAMQNEFNSLEIRERAAANSGKGMTDEDKRLFAGERAKIQRKYSELLQEPSVAPAAAISGKPSGSPTAPQSGFVVGEIYNGRLGPRRYLGGPINSPSSWGTP